MTPPIDGENPYEFSASARPIEIDSHQDVIGRTAAIAKNYLSVEKFPQVAIAAAAVGIVGIGASVVYILSQRRIERILTSSQANREDSLRSLVEQSAKFRQEQTEELIEPLIRNFINQHWEQLEIPPACINEKNKRFLLDKITAFLKNTRALTGWNQQICLKIVANFMADLKLVTHRFITSCRIKTFQAAFRLNASQLGKLSVEVLGKETHNQGKNVYLITFQRKKIVYKPRSMLPEYLIYNRQNGLFAKAGLGAYTVYLQEDRLKKEKYGYCDFLDYTIEGSTFYGENQLAEYFTKIAKIEGFAQALQLTDLHSANLIIHEHTPFLIDVEAILHPSFSKQFTTGLISGNFAGALEFPEEDSENRFFLRQIPLPLGENGIDLENRISTELATRVCKAWKDWGTFIRLKGKRVQKDFHLEIETIKGKLVKEYARVVPIDTSALVNLLYDSPDDAKDIILKDLKENLQKLGYRLTDRKCVEKGIEQDLLNNDVPVFYYHAKNDAIIYHNKIIARV